MIKAGDIVFQVRKGGLFNKQPVTDRLGLVIKEHREKGAIPQFYVQFNQEDPKWYYQHDLEKIKFGKDN
jgi:hypothetical protein|tara:strand:+ start:89 stop:295 length:207 start_codon:yes stop_codon:yes gene_type:complete